MMLTLTIIFAALLIHYIIFLGKIISGLEKVKTTQRKFLNEDFVSVIIPFRNEATNLKRSLESITSQSFAKNRYEVIYVDDNSDDNSVKVLQENIRHKNVRIIKSPFTKEERAHKKKALKYAIEQSKGEIIITTDADCHHKAEWLKTMVNMFDENTGFVSGPVEFVSNGKLYGDLQKLEFSSLIIVGAGLIGINQPIICNAANLGFRKSVFNAVGGYDDNLNISSGDDEFLMQKISANTNYNVEFCYDKNAISFTHPAQNVDEFYQQRKRWASKSLHYIKRSVILKLLLIFLFYFSLPLQLLLGIFYDKIFLFTFAGSGLIKFVMDFIVLKKGSENLFGKVNIMQFIVAELLHVPYILISAVSGVFGNYKWKGREIKR